MEMCTPKCNNDVIQKSTNRNLKKRQLGSNQPFKFHFDIFENHENSSEMWHFNSRHQLNFEERLIGHPV